MDATDKKFHINFWYIIAAVLGMLLIGISFVGGLGVGAASSSSTIFSGGEYASNPSIRVSSSCLLMKTLATRVRPNPTATPNSVAANCRRCQPQ